MLTEYQALAKAQENIEAAMGALEEFPGGSYIADEVYNVLDNAYVILERRLGEITTEGAVMPGEAVGLSGTSLDLGVGEGEGLPDPLLDLGSDFWLELVDDCPRG